MAIITFKFRFCDSVELTTAERLQYEQRQMKAIVGPLECIVASIALTTRLHETICCSTR